jgi:ferredoxin
MKRKIVKIDESKCDGCGDCVPSCAEGALQIIDGKARLISDLFCDGLGACLGHCPQEAITIEEREAEPYDERQVMDYIIKGGTNVITAHLQHLKDHNELEYLKTAVSCLEERGIDNPLNGGLEKPLEVKCGCPGSQTLELDVQQNENEETGMRSSQLRQWPVQLHLVSPRAPYFQNADLILTADCVPFAYADFHKDYLKGKGLAIACPKLDSNKQIYLEKLISMIDDSNINSINVLIMQVPCCSGLLNLAEQTVDVANRKIQINYVVFGINGNVLEEGRLN